MYYHGGLGDTTEQGVGIGVSTGAAVTGAVLAPGVVSVAALAVPIIGGIAAAGMLIYAWISRRNAQKVAATHVVDEAEPYLQKNRDAFLAAVAAGVVTESDRAAALAQFDAVWAQVVHECSNPALGAAGQRCTSERQQGGCLPNVDPCTNWFKLYRDPIEQAVIPVNTAAGFGIPAGWIPAGVSPAFAAIVAGLVIAAVVW